MDHAIRREHVWLDDGRLIDLGGLAVDRDGNRLPVDSLDLLTIEGYDVALDDAVNRGQAEPRAPLLRREEGLEDLLQDQGGNADALFLAPRPADSRLLDGLPAASLPDWCSPDGSRR